MSAGRRPLGLFEGFGIEIEYVLADRDTLDVRPWADRLLHAATGAWESDHDDGPIGWSNELVRHLIELKTNGPVPDLARAAAEFHASLGRAAALLAPWNARLFPTGMHPWMDPRRETELWPHEGHEIYRAYDRIFDCRRHGWANVQATHLNLPFAGEDELARLLAAVRLVLPLLPALAASSPVVEGRTTELLDNRLSFCRTNSARVPEMTGIVIPEPVYDAATYRRAVLAPIDARLAPLDTDGILVGHEWLNARGAIVRFDRDAIEVRLLDTQECPRADLGLCAAVVGVLRALVAERWSSLAAQRAHASEPLAALLERAIATGPAAALEDPAYAAHFGSRATTAGALWQELVAATFDGPPELAAPVGLVLSHGTLAQRIQRALGREPSRERLRAVYLELCGCLSDGALFDAP